MGWKIYLDDADDEDVRRILEELDEERTNAIGDDQGLHVRRAESSGSEEVLFAETPEEIPAEKGSGESKPDTTAMEGQASYTSRTCTVCGRRCRSKKTTPELRCGSCLSTTKKQAVRKARAEYAQVREARVPAT